MFKKKGGGDNSFLNNVQKNYRFGGRCHPLLYFSIISTYKLYACRWFREPAWCPCTGTTWRSTGGPAPPRSPIGGISSQTPPPSTSSPPALPSWGCPGSPSTVRMPSSDPIIAPSLSMGPQSSDNTSIGGLSNIHPDRIEKNIARIANAVQCHN